MPILESNVKMVLSALDVRMPRLAAAIAVVVMVDAVVIPIQNKIVILKNICDKLCVMEEAFH